MSNNYQRHNLHHHHCKHCKDHRHQMALHQRFFITQEIFTTHMIMITIIFITMMMMIMIMIMKMNMMKMSLMMMMMMNDMKMITDDFHLILSPALQQQKESDLPPKGAQLTKQMDVRISLSSLSSSPQKHQWSFLGLW